MFRRILSSFFVLLLTAGMHADDQQWTRFRGPDGSGVSSATTVPTTWSEEDYNWKIQLDGVGHSSPVVWRNRIFVASADATTAQRSLHCLDTADGRMLWRRDDSSTTYKQHRDNGFATSTPAVDASGVVVAWTTPEQINLLALDLEGRELWRRDLGPFVGLHGSGTSPILIDDLVVLANDQESPKLMERFLPKGTPIGPAGKSCLIAVDRRTGETRWQIPRRTALAPYSTPCVRRTDTGEIELIFTSMAHGITAVAPSTGRINWEIDAVFLDRCVGSPVAAHSLVIAGFGYGRRGDRCVAVRPNSSSPGQAPTIVYDVRKSVPLVPTPLVKDKRLYLWCDDGVVSCLNVRTGELIWRERMDGEFYGSPIWVDHRLYCIAKSGDVVVIAAADEFELISRVPLGESSFATPAVSGGVMYLRTASQLFSLGRAE